MTTPPYVGYYTADPSATDRSHLRTLSICHYVFGGLACAFSLLFLIHLGMGIMMVRGSFFGQSVPPDARVGGWALIAVGAGLLFVGETVGILNIVSGRMIASRRARTFSLIMAGVDCTSIPIGTTLGVFTFIVLLRPSVKWLYDQSALPSTA